MTSRFTKAASQLPFLEGLRFAKEGEELSTRQRAWRWRDITPAKGACAGGTRDHSTHKKRQRHAFWCSNGSPGKMKGQVDTLLAHWFLACVHSKRWGSLRRICAMAAATASSEGSAHPHRAASKSTFMRAAYRTDTKTSCRHRERDRQDRVASMLVCQACGHVSQSTGDDAT